MVVYPDNLIKPIQKRWQSSANDDAAGLRLPAESVLRQLLDVTYHASMLTEEGRSLRFQVAYCSFAEASRWNRTNDDGVGLSLMVMPFDRDFPFDADNLRRLAPATDPSRTLIAVHRNRDPGRRKELEIWGLLEINASSVIAKGVAKRLWPDVLTIASSEPGTVAISRQSTHIVRLRQGKISLPITGLFQNGPVGDFFQSGVQKLKTEVEKQLGRGLDSELDDQLFRSSYLDSIRRLLSFISEAGHGGAVLMVPEGTKPDSKRLAALIKRKFPCDSNRLWVALQAELLGKKRRQLAEFGGNQPAPALPQRSGSDVYDAISFVASLSAVDGALLVTDQLRVLGFGVEVTATTKPVSVKRASDAFGEEAKPIPFDSQGTRHRSAFRFCAAFKEATAFIMSQDGGIKAARKSGDDVIVWQDVANETDLEV